LEARPDHARQRLRSARPAPGDPYVQIQLVPSAGMEIAPESVATGKDGLIFNVDATHVRLKKNLSSARREPRLWPIDRWADMAARDWAFVRLDFLGAGPDGRPLWPHHFDEQGWLVRYQPVDV